MEMGASAAMSGVGAGVSSLASLDVPVSIPVSGSSLGVVPQATKTMLPKVTARVA
jgi:hypothetical protein